MALIRAEKASQSVGARGVAVGQDGFHGGGGGCAAFQGGQEPVPGGGALAIGRRRAQRRRAADSRVVRGRGYGGDGPAERIGRRAVEPGAEHGADEKVVAGPGSARRPRPASRRAASPPRLGSRRPRGRRPDPAAAAPRPFDLGRGRALLRTSLGRQEHQAVPRGEACARATPGAAPVGAARWRRRRAAAPMAGRAAPTCAAPASGTRTSPRPQLARRADGRAWPAPAHQRRPARPPPRR